MFATSLRAEQQSDQERSASVDGKAHRLGAGPGSASQRESAPYLSQYRGPKKMIAEPEDEIHPAIDVRVLEELAHMQRHGQPGFMNRVITMFLETAPTLIAHLEAASASDGLAVLQRTSHTLKPCSSIVGALSLAALCESLEQMARSGSVPDQAARVAAIVEEFTRVEASLVRRLSDAG